MIDSRYGLSSVLVGNEAYAIGGFATHTGTTDASLTTVNVLDVTDPEGNGQSIMHFISQNHLPKKTPSAYACRTHNYSSIFVTMTRSMEDQAANANEQRVQ
jgi:hypothetical protein